MMISILLVCLASYTSAQNVEKNWTQEITKYTRDVIRGARGNVLFEYDMLLPLKQVQSAVDTGIMNLTGDWKWKRGIVPYKIDRRLRCRSRFGCFFRWRAQIWIEEAIAEWQNKTCIQFVKATESDKDYVYFKSNDKQICASFVGRVGGKQTVQLAPFCRNKGAILHQIGHVLGLIHEHSRTDRDNNVNIQWDKINKGKWYNYQMYEVQHLPRLLNDYDTKSIMHLGYRRLDKNVFHNHIIPKMGFLSTWKELRKTDADKVNEFYKEECEDRKTIPLP